MMLPSMNVSRELSWHQIVKPLHAQFAQRVQHVQPKPLLPVLYAKRLNIRSLGPPLAWPVPSKDSVWSIEWMSLKTAGSDSTMTLLLRNVLIAPMGSNAVFPQKLYVRKEPSMIRTLRSVSNVQMCIYVSTTKQVAPTPHQTAGAMERIQLCQV